MLAIERYAGEKIRFEDQDYIIEGINRNSFDDGIDIALFSAGESISMEFAPAAVERGAIVIDNTYVFRMYKQVPLIIPEVNPDAMSRLFFGKGVIIANPNCATIMCLIAMTPLDRYAKVEFDLSTFFSFVFPTRSNTRIQRILNVGHSN
ncbi:hypothetical protein IFM89_002573 [Coptis chinensis]|uniref:Semialdehyde dehydrogenase NAD-binding domain-containing protein n=1 Tax=Coptis chinensis TaxID=261450 RepID=A0A835LM75_9MAGN|nr:hypothetical protein IFM89_002573 [Coptis chinensis]